MRSDKPKALVTRESLQQWVAAQPVSVIGRALAAIYNRQTAEEQHGGFTKFNNGIGFSGFDAEIGSRCAEHFIAHGTLEAWMVKIWSTPGKNGFPKICRYARQLNEVALRKQANNN